MEEKYKKVGNTSFHTEAINKMRLKDFKKYYGEVLAGQDLDKLYEEVTGKKLPASDIKE